MDLQVIIPAIELAAQVSKKINRTSPNRMSNFGPEKLFGTSVARALMLVDDGEDGIAESDSSDEEGELNNLYDREYIRNEWFEGGLIGGENFDEELENRGNDMNTAGIKFRWRADANMNTPVHRCNRGETKIKDECAGCFKTPLSSFLSFVPIKVFK